MNENKTAQEVLRATLQDFMLLYVHLRERFQQNTDIEKEKHLQEFENLKLGRDTLRDYYGRIDTLATVLRTIVKVHISDEQIKRTLFLQSKAIF